MILHACLYACTPECRHICQHIWTSFGYQPPPQTLLADTAGEEKKDNNMTDPFSPGSQLGPWPQQTQPLEAKAWGHLAGPGGSSVLKKNW